MLEKVEIQNQLFSIQMLADVLSTSKSTIQAKVNKGELSVCPKTGKISGLQALRFPEFRRFQESNWEKELATVPKRRYQLVELFAGGGGLAIGLEQAGFASVLLNEIDRDACKTLRFNRPDWNVVEGDVANIDWSKLDYEVDLLTGGFPCQAFSYAGKSLGFEDTRGTLFFEMAKAIKELRPKVFMAENVRALMTHDSGRTLETIKHIIGELGYTVIAPKLMRALFYKVPQKRERLIIVGVRADLASRAQFKWPSTYSRILTLRDAFYEGDLYDSDVPESPGQEYPQRKKQILSQVPQGGYWRDLPIELQKEYMKGSFYLGGGKTGMARRLSLDEPSLTLTCAPAQKQTERCHPIETRPLTTREYARIQTFPDTWQFQGSMTSIYKQIGNAVPVNLSAALGRSLVRFLNEMESCQL